MASTIHLLQQAATKLRQEGKQPSLALFKARLAGQVSAPELFSAYQQWRQHPEQYAETSPVDEPAINQQINAEPDLCRQLDRIEQKLDHLLALLERNNVSG